MPQVSDHPLTVDWTQVIEPYFKEKSQDNSGVINTRIHEQTDLNVFLLTSALLKIDCQGKQKKEPKPLMVMEALFIAKYMN